MPDEGFITPPDHRGFRIKQISRSDGNGAPDIMLAYVEPGGGGAEPPHCHAHDHLFSVMQGCATIQAGEETITLRQHETRRVSGSTPHSVWNRSDEELILLNCNVAGCGA